MSSSASLDGQIALVTGASRGIGRAVALALAGEGAEVVVNYASSPDAAEAVVAEIQANGGSAYALQADVADEPSVEDMIKTVLTRSGRIDVLVNNAGITRDGLVDEDENRGLAGGDQSQSHRSLPLHKRAVTRPMLKQRSGRIINITSVVGLMGNAGQANYAAAKAGVVGLTRSSAKEMASRGITVNAVAPGFIATDMTKDLEADAILAAIPLGRFGTPDQVAGTVRFLAADPAAAYITGTGAAGGRRDGHELRISSGEADQAPLSSGESAGATSISDCGPSP